MRGTNKACRRGFEITVEGRTYLVKFTFADITGSKDQSRSGTFHAVLEVFDEDGTLVKLSHSDYLTEKIADFAMNSVNGQDSVYWDWNGENRHGLR